MFQLHPVLAEDTWYLGDFPLSALLLSRDANYPWFILVPRVAHIEEIHQLDNTQRYRLMDESCALGQILQRVYAADKLNIAALGNVVPQLHVHHIVRYHNDAAWPAPIWGAVESCTYDENTLQHSLDQLIPALLSADFSARENIAE